MLSGLQEVLEHGLHVSSRGVVWADAHACILHHCGKSWLQWAEHRQQTKELKETSALLFKLLGEVRERGEGECVGECFAVVRDAGHGKLSQ